MAETITRKRHYPRAPVDSPVQYRTPSGHQYGARTGNISTGGVFLIADDPQVAPAESIELALQLPGLNGPMLVRCRVVWISQQPLFRGSRLHGFGVQFVNLSDGEVFALAALVENYCRLWDEGHTPTA